MTKYQNDDIAACDPNHSTRDLKVTSYICLLRQNCIIIAISMQELHLLLLPSLQGVYNTAGACVARTILLSRTHEQTRSQDPLTQWVNITSYIPCT